MRADGRDDGSDMGEIDNISPVLKPLCRKAFPEIKGEMSMIPKNGIKNPPGTSRPRADLCKNNLLP
jgi:hypothetical protein